MTDQEHSPARRDLTKAAGYGLGMGVGMGLGLGVGIGVGMGTGAGLGLLPEARAEGTPAAAGAIWRGEYGVRKTTDVTHNFLALPNAVAT